MRFFCTDIRGTQKGLIGFRCTSLIPGCIKILQ